MAIDMSLLPPFLSPTDELPPLRLKSQQSWGLSQISLESLQPPTSARKQRAMTLKNIMVEEKARERAERVAARFWSSEEKRTLAAPFLAVSLTPCERDMYAAPVPNLLSPPPPHQSQGVPSLTYSSDSGRSSGSSESGDGGWLGDAIGNAKKEVFEGLPLPPQIHDASKDAHVSSKDAPPASRTTQSSSFQLAPPFPPLERYPSSSIYASTPSLSSSLTSSSAPSSPRLANAVTLGSGVSLGTFGGDTDFGADMSFSDMCARADGQGDVAMIGLGYVDPEMTPRPPPYAPPFGGPPSAQSTPWTTESGFHSPRRRPLPTVPTRSSSDPALTSTPMIMGWTPPRIDPLSRMPPWPPSGSTTRSQTVPAPGPRSQSLDDGKKKTGSEDGPSSPAMKSLAKILAETSISNSQSATRGRDAAGSAKTKVPNSDESVDEARSGDDMEDDIAYYLTSSLDDSDADAVLSPSDSSSSSSSACSSPPSSIFDSDESGSSESEDDEAKDDTIRLPKKGRHEPRSLKPSTFLPPGLELHAALAIIAGLQGSPGETGLISLSSSSSSSRSSSILNASCESFPSSSLTSPTSRTTSANANPSTYTIHPSSRVHPPLPTRTMYRAKPRRSRPTIDPNQPLNLFSEPPTSASGGFAKLFRPAKSIGSMGPVDSVVDMAQPSYRLEASFLDA